MLHSSQVWQALTTAATKQATTGLLDIDQSAYLENKQWLDRLCIAYMNLALRRLGAFDNPDQSYSFETLFETCQIIPRYRQLFQRWLEVLVEAGQLQQHEQGFRHLAPCSQGRLNELTVEVRARWASTPQIVGLIQHCGENLHGILTGEKEPLELFATLVDDPIQSHPDFFLYAYYKAILRASLEQVVQSLPISVRLRIVEIGGGTGLATRELLPVLPDRQTEYCFTDVGGLFLKQAQQKFRDYPFMQYRLLDIDQSPLEQGFTNHSFDVAIAFNVLHVARNLDTTLEHVRTLLAPNGILLLWEITQPTVDFDMTFGLLMNPLEDGTRTQSNPFLSPEQWQAALQRHGFAEVAAVPTPNEFGQHIVLAQAEAISASPTTAAFTALVESATVPSVSESSKRELTDWFYLPSWRRSGLLQKRKSLNQPIDPQCWLVFVDQSEFGNQLIERLERAGQTVIVVRIGEQFSDQSEFSTYRLAARHYTINPQQEDDYNRLLADLKTQPQLPTQIVHLWSVTPSSDNQSQQQNWDRAQTLGFNSLLFLAQAIGTQNFTHGIELIVVSAQMQSVTGEEILCPEKALLLGAVKVIPFEYSNVDCRSVDILLPAANRESTDQLVELLLQELLTPSSESVIAYRGNHRWVQTFEPVPLDETFQGTDRLKQGGVYLITGGLGNIGLTVAHYFAETVQANLILVGRSAFPERQNWEQWLVEHPPDDRISSQIRSLQALEQMGSTVWVVQADVAQMEQMRSVVAGAQERFGQIHGVVHAAGVLGAGAIQSRTLEEVNRVLASKVRGTQILDVLFSEIPLNFLVLFSSLSSITPVFGQVAYCAASNFLDAFTHYRSRQHQTFTTCINWSVWQGEGMAYKAGKSSVVQQLQAEHFKQRGILPSEGIEVFSRILGSALPQVLVSTWDDLSVAKPRNTRTNGTLETIAPTTGSIAKHVRPALKTDYVAPRNELEQTLADVWQELLGIESIGVDDDFFELGGDSLFATQATSRIRESLQVNLSMQTLFEHPTIRGLSECLVRQEPEPGRVAAIARARQKLKQMSAEDIQRILQTKNGRTL
jgi:NAD(P)-dependent dehydrogenase (short-subunit alcohol dehydrogenase family)/SAM-dependent methyltransferase